MRHIVIQDVLSQSMVVKNGVLRSKVQKTKVVQAINKIIECLFELGCMGWVPRLEQAQNSSISSGCTRKLYSC